MDHLTLAKAQAIEQEYIFTLYTQIRQPIVVVRGQGALVWDAQGKEYLDLVSGGRAVTGVGHCHPRVVEAIQRQAGELIHMTNDFYTEPQMELARMLGGLSSCRRVFLCNSGAEANEAAIKLARKWAKLKHGPLKFEIITALNSFHGRTLATITATGQPKYQQGFEPLVPGFRYVPYNDLPTLKEAMRTHVCAVMLEPVLGESGVYPATQEYLHGARELCDQHGALLILDEVQTGLGRTGKMFAFQHYDLEPDIFTLAKGLGGGVPIGAMLAKESAAVFEPGDHASTFGGTPLTAAAAVATLKVIEEEGLVENARAMGAYLVDGLRSLQATHSVIAGIRGIGMMIAADLAQPIAGKLRADCLQRGLLINIVGNSMLRLIPPMVLTREQADRAISILDESLAQVVAAA